MTYAQAANKETCAGKDCHAPVEMDIAHERFKVVDGEPTTISVSIGYCLECAINIKV
jgi:hypothetical protein